MIQFHCAKCQLPLQIDDSFVGRLIRCPRCAHEALVPPPSAPPVAAPPPAPVAPPLAPPVPQPPPPPAAPLGAPAPTRHSPFAAITPRRLEPQDEDEDPRELRALIPRNAPSSVRRLGKPLFRIITPFKPGSRLKRVVGRVLMGLAIPFLVAGIIGLVGGNVSSVGTLLTFILLGGGGYAALHEGRKRPKTMSKIVFEEGLLDLQGRECEVFFWDEIDAYLYYRHVLVIFGEFQDRREVTTIHTYRARDGRSFKLEGKESGYFSLLERFLEPVLARIQRNLLEKFERGETVELGEFQLHIRGIAFRDKSLPWDRVRSVDLRNGEITIRTRVGSSVWAKIPYADVPNANVFLAVCFERLGYDLPEADPNNPFAFT